MRAGVRRGVYRLRRRTLGSEGPHQGGYSRKCERQGAVSQTAVQARRQFARVALLLHTSTLLQRNGPMSSSHHASIPAWAWAIPLLATALLALKFAHIVPPMIRMRLFSLVFFSAQRCSPTSITPKCLRSSLASLLARSFSRSR